MKTLSISYLILVSVFLTGCLRKEKEKIVVKNQTVTVTEKASGNDHANSGRTFGRFLESAQAIVPNPFSNKIFSFDGRFLRNVATQERYLLPFATQIELYSTPIAIDSDVFVFRGKHGKIFSYNTKSLEGSEIYQSARKCTNYLGCIYSMALYERGSFFFTEKRTDDSEDILVWDSGLVSTVVKDFPARLSGPLWRTGTGGLGVLPYMAGLHKLELDFPLNQKSYKDIAKKVFSIDAGGIAGFEGGQGTVVVNQYNPAALETNLLMVASEFAGGTALIENIDESASAYTLEPCFGEVLSVQKDGSEVFLDRSLEFNTSYNSFTCPTLENKWVVTEKNAKVPATSSHLRIAGYPSGVPEVPSVNVFSLGHEGSITLTSETPLKDIEGNELRIFENAFYVRGTNKLFGEPGRVELSADGVNWEDTGCDCANPSDVKCAGLQATDMSSGNGVLPWENEAGGLGIDIAEYGLTQLKSVRITDCGVSQANGGFDLDTIIANPAALDK